MSYFVSVLTGLWAEIEVLARIGATSQLFESASLTLILLLGYLGFDRVGEKNTKKRISEIFDKILNTRKESASLYFSKPKEEFDFGRDVGEDYICSVYLIKAYVGFLQQVEKPDPKNRKSPKKFDLYWVVCDAIEDKDEIFPLKLAAISAVKFFAFCLFGVFVEFHWLVAITSIIFDAICVAWVVWRVYLLTGIEPTLLFHVQNWDKWFEGQTKKILSV
jgi:hypothetical protein